MLTKIIATYAGIGEETSPGWTMGVEMERKLHLDKEKHVYRQENAAAG